jgi:predicted negative regulator of RcsB-dependent stress response
MSETPTAFLDVPHLLEASQPRPRPIWAWYAMLAAALFILTSTWAAGQNKQLQNVVQPLGFLLMLGVIIGMSVFASHAVKQQRQEQQRLEAVEELVQLRRWDQAGAMLDALLAQPTRSGAARLQALIYLASVLARYHRFADAIAVQNYLLENARMDPAATHSLKVMRAMALLHEDQLFDVDKALSDLRREAPDSAGLALVEIYRDVKTGHPAEAIDIVQSRLPAMRAQLGHRVADVHALAARAYDLLDRDAEAAAAYERATLLSPAEELIRRYPELAPLGEKYTPAAAPAKEAAA